MKLLFIGTYPPTRCGIATFTQHLRQGVIEALHLSDEMLPVAPILPDQDTETSPHHFILRKQQLEDYLWLAEQINLSDIDVISLQHEFGIFGGEAGRHIVPFLRSLNKPVITTFHTVFEKPPEPYKSVQAEIIQHSDRVMVMNRLAIPYLTNHFPIRPEKIVYLPHGAPKPPVLPRETIRKMHGLNERKVMLTFGLLSPGKGIEMLLQILPDVIAKVPDLLYVIAGQTHPEIKKQIGERYREELEDRVTRNHLETHVRFVNRYLSEEELRHLLAACDLYVTPYPGIQQITSGTLAYAVGLGRPILSTPYAHARDLLHDYPELLLPYDQPDLWREQLIRLLGERDVLARYEQAMEQLGREMSWDVVGRKFYHICQDMMGLQVVK